jgi:hypothetical protein
MRRFCDHGACVTPQTLACKGAGGRCATTADCCNGTVVACVGGLCTPDFPQ